MNGFTEDLPLLVLVCLLLTGEGLWAELSFRICRLSTLSSERLGGSENRR